MKLRTAAMYLAFAAGLALLAGAVATVRAQSGSPGPFDDIENHFKCYDIYSWEGFEETTVTLKDQFGVSTDVVVRPRLLCNPVRKNETEPPEPDIHLVCYQIIEDSDPAPHLLEVKNQFGVQLVKAQQPELLCLPSSKKEILG
ncbi:MAG: DUF7450 family protein [Candidatus Rokuibacteriota bacterium]